MKNFEKIKNTILEAGEQDDYDTLMDVKIFLQNESIKIIMNGASNERSEKISELLDILQKYI